MKGDTPAQVLYCRGSGCRAEVVDIAEIDHCNPGRASDRKCDPRRDLGSLVVGKVTRSVMY